MCEVVYVVDMVYAMHEVFLCKSKRKMCEFCLVFFVLLKDTLFKKTFKFFNWYNSKLFHNIPLTDTNRHLLSFQCLIICAAPADPI